MVLGFFVKFLVFLKFLSILDIYIIIINEGYVVVYGLKSILFIFRNL